MKKVNWLPVLLLTLADGAGARAQERIGPVPSRPDLPISGSVQSIRHHHPHHSIRFYTSPGFRGPIGYPFCDLPLGQGAVLYYSPGLYSLPFPGTFVPALPMNVYDDQAWGLLPPRQRRAEILPPPVPAPPKVIDVPPRELRPPRREPAPLPGAALPAVDPKVETDRKIRLGKEAMADREYTRAERRFEGATMAAPEEPHAHFLLAQARFSLGKYQEAVATIHAGMGLQANWPDAQFSPRELYGTNVLEFPRLLRQLADTLAKHPEDPYLLFLYAYQLWFDDRRDDARLIFGRGWTVAADPSFCEQFLRIK